MNRFNLEKNKNYLLACSYGPDSMALFYLLKEKGYKFECAIVNYHLRKESDSEVEGLKKYCELNRIKLHVLDVKDVPSKNIEARCRNTRYKFFKDLSDQYGYDAVLVAHHQDDLIETYLMQKQRQNCPIFYGINENTTINGVKIIRPLLHFTKAELEQICLKNHVPYSVDKSNFDLSIKRNKIRHSVVLKMSKKEREQIIAEINDENKHLEQRLKDIDLSKLDDINYVLYLDQLSQQYAFNLKAKKLDDSLYLSKENVGQVINNLKSHKSNGQFIIKNGLFLLKEYDHFEFLNKKIEKIDYQYNLNEPSKLNTPFFYLDFTKDSKNRNVSLSDYPLVIRNIRPNDSVLINGYKATARRLMIDWKVPYRKRLIWPVIINKENKCIYIPRYQKEFKPSINCNFFVK